MESDITSMKVLCESFEKWVIDTIIILRSDNLLLYSGK